MIRYHSIPAAAIVIGTVLANAATAQPLGTFRWQLQPFCNVVTVVVTQNDAVYRLEGTDDQCGNGGDAASVTGTAFPNADGTIGFGLNIVTTPGGRPLHVDAEITTGNFSGSWRDSAGASGAFALTPGAGSGGTARPLPGPTVPSAIQLRTDGSFVAGGAENVGAIPATGAGTRMMWYPGKAAFRAGKATGDRWNDANVGFGSVAFGTGTQARGVNSVAVGLNTHAVGANSAAFGSGSVATGSNSTAMGSTAETGGANSLSAGINTNAFGDNSIALGDFATASGPASVATGLDTAASGDASTAMGSGTRASGPQSTALGASTTASGPSSMAMGNFTTASGSASTAIGQSSVAAGDNSFAAGLRVTANGAGSVVLGSDALARTVAPGTFLFGDQSTSDDMVATLPNQFLVRAAGGVVFHTNAALSAGVQIGPDGSQWLSFSDVNMKRDFRALDGETVLGKLAQMPVQEWSYRAQDAAIRHVGPTAQDFHAAFGLGEDPLRIGTLDADGVALAAVKALEARTRDGAAWRARLVALEAVNDELRARLARLESLLERR